VVPYDAATGASLWPHDTNQWNNSTRVPGTIVMDSAVCQ